MNLRPFMTLLLTITLGLTNAGFGRGGPSDTTTVDATAVDEGDDEISADEKITADEEREAREIIALLMRRWRETEDVAPLADEFFVTDFADRLRYEPQLLFFAELKKEGLGPKDSEDLRRHYVAMTNLIHLFMRLYEVYAPLHKSGEDEEDVDPRKILPADVLEALNSHPRLAAIYAEETGDKVETPDQSPEQSAEKQAAMRAETVEQLRALTDALERAVILMRDHVRTLPSTLTASEIIKEQASQTDSESAESYDPTMPHVRILGEQFYGYPAGTRLIYVHSVPFHIDLVRAEGQRLKVLSVYIQGD